MKVNPLLSGRQPKKAVEVMEMERNNKEVGKRQKKAKICRKKRKKGKD